MQIGITLIGIIAGAFSGATLAGRLAGWLMEQGLSERVAEPLAYGSVVTLITYLSLIIGELVPKQIALRNPEKIACLVAPAMTILSRVASPLVSLLDLSGKLVLALLGQRAVPASRVTDEEIKTLVAEAETAGVLEPEERAMITRVMRLADRPVRAVMTPRHDVDMINLADDDETNRKLIIETTHSRLPVYEGSADAVLGVIQAKDLLDRCLQNGPLNIRESVRSAPVVPDTMDTLDVVALLKASPVHIGLVHDEYGHFQGVVTSADILEAIVGEFRHEEGASEPDLVRRADGSYLVSGRHVGGRTGGSLRHPAAGGPQLSHRRGPRARRASAGCRKSARACACTAGSSRSSTWTAGGSTRSCSAARCRAARRSCNLLPFRHRAALQVHDLDHVAVGIVEIGAAALEGALAAVLFLDDRDAFFGEEFLGVVVFLRRHAKGGVDVVLVLAVRIDRILRIGQHEVVVAAGHEHHVVVAPDAVEAENFLVEFFRAVEVLHRNGEVQQAVRLDH